MDILSIPLLFNDFLALPTVLYKAQTACCNPVAIQKSVRCLPMPSGRNPWSVLMALRHLDSTPPRAPTGCLEFSPSSIGYDCTTEFSKVKRRNVQGGRIAWLAQSAALRSSEVCANSSILSLLDERLVGESVLESKLRGHSLYVTLNDDLPTF